MGNDGQARGPRRGAPARAAAAGLCLAAAAATLSGCGGGSQATAGEPSASFEVKLAGASFPAKQSVAKVETLQLTVENTGEHAIPNVAVTVDSFNYASSFAGLAANKRPVWVIERGPGTPAKLPVESQEVSIPGGAQTNYVNTWALGRLAANRKRTFSWRVVPVKSGSYTVRYSVAAGLAGKAKAQLAGGGPASGSFRVQIAGAPAVTHVDPKTGKVVPGVYPVSP
ncbi:MAG TPA: hypothetical protein VN618_00725 [Solirubrobacteraceae bacterium]|nr:hypothetical protein [Solirubrobacteraceae bacterium]